MLQTCEEEPELGQQWAGGVGGAGLSTDPSGAGVGAGHVPETHLGRQPQGGPPVHSRTPPRKPGVTQTQPGDCAGEAAQPQGGRACVLRQRAGA